MEIYVSATGSFSGEETLIGTASNNDVAFDTWGDEVEGISLIRYVSSILSHLLMIERAGAISGERVINLIGESSSSSTNPMAPEGVDILNEEGFEIVLYLPILPF